MTYNLLKTRATLQRVIITDVSTMSGGSGRPRDFEITKRRVFINNVIIRVIILKYFIEMNDIIIYYSKYLYYFHT